MGCVCCSIGSFVSVLLDALERVSLCTLCAMLTCCLLCTILIMLVLGIGIGFHYCVVQSQVDAMGRAAKAVGALRSGDTLGMGPPMRRALDRARLISRDKRFIDDPPLKNNDTVQNFTTKHPSLTTKLLSTEFQR